MIETDLAFAKVNISLDIVSKLDNGYHEMLMVMQSVSLYDEVTVECIPGEGINVTSGLPYVPSDGRNIAARAALAFFAHTGIAGYRTHINIEKKIPICAGLGGGSSDGACVLRMLDRMFGTKLGRSKLEVLGSGIGSDVPFCVAGGTVLAKGRGESLSDTAPLPPCHFVICKPPFSFSTPELFGLIRCEKIRARPDTGGIIASLGKGDLGGVARRMYNVFEDFLPRGARDIADIKSALLEHGALGAVMSGSGSAAFGIFDNGTDAKNAFECMRTGYDDCFLCEPTEKLGLYWRLP
ncbi:MAG: 4-(cytidine 5'-diphospho)-2-C-methyl-D-erythritol kinase [Oscillospiraceae bacterium]|jgi:4-diphosphocytidyl-2-C-methyl-D-erythritol kinase|nr:4-(cytidine 5'-diphospho)-2-C-methyl-D-erythritol kinase [Oscillospiraceae bacterium]